MGGRRLESNRRRHAGNGADRSDWAKSRQTCASRFGRAVPRWPQNGTLFLVCLLLYLVQAHSLACARVSFDEEHECALCSARRPSAFSALGWQGEFLGDF
jgi:hypothetical protein